MSKTTRTDGILRDSKTWKLTAFRILCAEKAFDPDLRPVKAFDNRWAHHEPVGVVGYHRGVVSEVPNPGTPLWDTLLWYYGKRFELKRDIEDPKKGTLIYTYSKTVIDEKTGKERVIVWQRVWRVEIVRVIDKHKYPSIQMHEEYKCNDELCPKEAERLAKQVAQMRAIIEAEIEQPMHAPLVLDFRANEPKARPKTALPPKARKTPGWGLHRVFDPKA